MTDYQIQTAINDLASVLEAIVKELKEIKQEIKYLHNKFR